MKKPEYYVEREEIAHLVPDSAHTILDIGCGTGSTGALLKASRTDRTVSGIEIDERAARTAREVLDSVIVGDVQTMTIPFPHHSFDCLILADVLEHTVDPVAVLNNVAQFLTPGGTIVLSLPNIRHYSAIQRLISRGWKYEDSGVFDRTHLRFFSLSSMKELIQEAGFRIQHVEPKIVTGRKMHIVHAFTGKRFEEFVAFQYLFRAVPAGSRGEPVPE
jgi:2-polyprenyl-3-methyl-5-hydroxy-6-metoxy-1,4-benzoquinol methylase